MRRTSTSTLLVCGESSRSVKNSKIWRRVEEMRREMHSSLGRGQTSTKHEGATQDQLGAKYYELKGRASNLRGIVWPLPLAGLRTVVLESFPTTSLWTSLPLCNSKDPDSCKSPTTSRSGDIHFYLTVWDDGAPAYLQQSERWTVSSGPEA